MKRVLHWISIVISLLVLLISSAGVIAYFFDIPYLNLALFFPESIALTFNSALSFSLIALIGLCHQFRVFRRFQIAVIFVLGVLGTITFLYRLFGIDPMIDFDFFAHLLSNKYQHSIWSSIYCSSLVLALILGYFFLIKNILDRAYVATLAVAILSFAILMMIAVYLQFPLWSSSPLNEYVALLTTFLFVLSSLHLLIQAVKDYKSNQKTAYFFVPIWVAMLTLAIGFGLFMTWASYYDFNAKLMAQNKLNRASEEIQYEIDAVEKSMHRMADRWVFSKGFNEETWKADASRSVEDLKYLQHIIKLGSNNLPVWWVYLDHELTQDAPPSEYFASLESELAYSMAKERVFYDLGVNLFPGRKDLLLFFPLKVDDKNDGFFVAVLDEKEIIEDLIQRSGIALLKVRSNKHELLVSSVSSDLDHLRRIDSEIMVGGLSYYASGYYPITTMSDGHILVVVIASISIAGLFLGILYLKFNSDRLRIEAEFNERIARVTLEDSVMGVIRVKGSGHISYSNAAADRILGYNDNELLGQHLSILIPPDLREIHEKHFNGFLESPYSKKMADLGREIEAFRKDGVFVPIEIFLSYVKVGDEKEMLAFINDLTDKAERNRFFEMSLDLIAVMTTDDCFKEVNGAWANILGWTPDELVNKNFMSLVHPDDHLLLREAMHETRTRKAGLKLECRMITPAGAERWFWWTGSVFQQKLYLNGRDISDQKNKARILERLNESYEIINSVSNVGIWDFDVMLNSARWSTRYYQLLGYRDREIESSVEAYLKLVHPDDRDKIPKRVDAHFEGQAKIDYEVRLKVKNGNYRWFRIMGVIIANSSKQITRIMGSLQDIHPIKLAEENAERKLANYLGELQRSNRELEQFAYIASHDLQTPLRHIMSFTNLLTKKLKLDDDPEAGQWLIYINQGVRQMEQLILDLLAYSRIRKNEFKREEVDLNKVIESIRDVNHALTSEVTLEVSPLPIVKGYFTHLQQLFQNLIGNAAKFSRKDVPVKIKVSSRETPDEWIIAVEDNGIGINEDQFERIFQLFQRLHPKGSYEGTGIGLAICKKSAELHGGKIWLESTVGSGTTFYVSINKHQESNDDQD